MSRTSTETCMGKKQSRTSAHLYFLFACIVITPILVCACSHLSEGSAGSTFEEANDLFSQEKYNASLNKYGQILEKHPGAGDRVLFEMGIIYAYPATSKKIIRSPWNVFRES